MDQTWFSPILIFSIEITTMSLHIHEYQPIKDTFLQLCIYGWRKTEIHNHSRTVQFLQHVRHSTISWSVPGGRTAGDHQVWKAVPSNRKTPSCWLLPLDISFYKVNWKASGSWPLSMDIPFIGYTCIISLFTYTTISLVGDGFSWYAYASKGIAYCCMWDQWDFPKYYYIEIWTLSLVYTNLLSSCAIPLDRKYGQGIFLSC